MDEEALRSRSGLLLLISGFCIVIAAGVFVFVPLVEYRICNEEGRFSTAIVRNGRPAIYIDYCDCATFFEFAKTGKRGRITLLKALQRPKSLIIDYHGTGKGYKP